MRLAEISIATALLLATPAVVSTQPQTAPPDFKYEVVSIKPSKPDSAISLQGSPDGMSYKRVTLLFLIQRAYLIRDSQISGAPNWLKSETFDFEAKMDVAAADRLGKLPPGEQAVIRQQMLQTVLADRFKLTVHHETRQLPVYLLQVSKNGSKLNEAKPGESYVHGIKTPNHQGEGPGAVMFTRTPQAETLQAQAVPISTLLTQLARMSLGRPIQDKTGLTGNYDFKLTWSPETQVSANAPDGSGVLAASDPTGPSIFTALKEQLGLELVSGKGDVEYIVIDHVEHPSKN